MVKRQGSERAVRTLPSKSHSCSEMEKGHKSLVAIKKEHPDPVELAAEIKAHKMFPFVLNGFNFRVFEALTLEGC